MRRPITFYYNYLLAKVNARQDASDHYIGQVLCKDKPVLNARQTSDIIRRMLLENKPFMVGKFGANELCAIRTFDFQVHCKYQICMDMLCSGAGFFPCTYREGEKFSELMLTLISEADIMGLWKIPFEKYYLNHYGNENLATTFLLDIEPWSVPEQPWSAALKGKKVLVIHPFAETIRSQFQRRDEIFPGTDILPDFELKILKAVQTIAGETDLRFDTWFSALDWMYQEAMKTDFDVAILGCGAYGFPLAAMLKQAGKQAIHLGGATQILFGIKGKRWDEVNSYQFIRDFYNDSWVYPNQSEKPEGAKTVEDGCYW